MPPLAPAPRSREQVQEHGQDLPRRQPSRQPLSPRQVEPQNQPERRSVRPSESPRPQTRPRPAGDQQPGLPRRRRGGRWKKFVASAVAVMLIGSFAAYFWVDSRIAHVDALSGAAATPGTTYLIVGYDSRNGWIDDGAEGERTDTIMLLHVPNSGPSALISIPRDSYVPIPGHNPNKINAAYAFGGASLLVETVEQLSGLTVDVYVEVGFTGVVDVVDALGGVELCYDRDVSDDYSGMYWQAGCHRTDGLNALAFSRMRYQDPLGDIGRTARQQMVVSAVTKSALSPGTVLNPVRAVKVASAGAQAVTLNEGGSAWNLVKLGLAFRDARGPGGVSGTPPIASINHRVDGVGSTVLLSPELSPQFWLDVANGNFEPGAQVGGY